MHPTEPLIPRTQLLQELGISDSSERRLRQRSQDWPPHLTIGNRVYYRRCQIESWIAVREATSGRPGIPPEVHQALDQRAAELARSAPALTPREVVELREVFSRPAGGAS